MNIKLDQGKFGDMGALSVTQDIMPWQVLICCWNGSQKLGENNGLLLNKFKMQELPRQSAEERKQISQRTEHASMSLFHKSWEPTDYPWKGLENISLTTEIRDALERDVTVTEKLSSGCWLQAEADGRTCCYRAWLLCISEDDRIPE